LQEIQAYKEQLDYIIDHPETMQEQIESIGMNSVKEARDSLARFIPIIQTIASFVKQIKDYTLDQFPEFAEAYLNADFSPMLDIISMYKEFLYSFNKEQQKLLELCREIRKRAPTAFSNNKHLQLKDLDGVVATTFQRVGQYPLPLNELVREIDKIEDANALSKIATLILAFAKAWGHAINTRKTNE
jgi:hypothetical protein